MKPAAVLVVPEDQFLQDLIKEKLRSNHAIVLAGKKKTRGNNRGGGGFMATPGRSGGISNGAKLSNVGPSSAKRLGSNGRTSNHVFGRPLRDLMVNVVGLENFEVKIRL